MRFSKRIKVFPGFHLNISTSGISSTIGGKGASINISKRGTYLNSSIPGTGIRFSTKLANGQSSSHYTRNESVETIIVDDPDISIETTTSDLDELTSASMLELKDTLHEVFNDRMELSKEIQQVRNELMRAKNRYVAARIFLIGFVFKVFKNKVLQKSDYLTDLEEQLKNTIVNIDIHFDENFRDAYQSLVTSYQSLLTTEKIWDITATYEQDTRITRSAASTVVDRVPVNFKFDGIPIIQSSYPAFHLENKNGGDLYIYPAFVISTTNKREFGLIDIKDIQLTCSTHRFMERGTIPSDSLIVGQTWHKVNKDGSPDRRFSGNFQIPIVQYGEITITSSTGMNETYSFSSVEKAKAFADSFNNYESCL